MNETTIKTEHTKAPDEIRGQIYRHWRGGLYTLLLLAETHEHNGDLDIVYVSHTTGKIVTRPAKYDSRRQDAWTDLVEWPDGKNRRRFTPETEETRYIFEGP